MTLDLISWLRQQCRKYAFDVVATYRRQGSHEWPLVAEDDADPELYKLVVSYHDIEYAHNNIELAAKFEHEHRLQAALELAAVVCYARPFSGNRAHGTKWNLPKANWPAYSDKASKKFHRYLIKLRNENYAHSDASIRDPSFWADGGSNRATIAFRRLMWADQLAMIDMTRDLRDRLKQAADEALKAHPLVKRPSVSAEPELTASDSHPWRKPYIAQRAAQEAEARRLRGGSKYPGLPMNGGLG